MYIRIKIWQSLFITKIEHKTILTTPSSQKYWRCISKTAKLKATPGLCLTTFLPLFQGGLGPLWLSPERPLCLVHGSKDVRPCRGTCNVQPLERIPNVVFQLGCCWLRISREGRRLIETGSPQADVEHFFFFFWDFEGRRFVRRKRSTNSQVVFFFKHLLTCKFSVSD